MSFPLNDSGIDSLDSANCETAQSRRYSDTHPSSLSMPPMASVDNNSSGVFRNLEAQMPAFKLPLNWRSNSASSLALPMDCQRQSRDSSGDYTNSTGTATATATAGTFGAKHSDSHFKSNAIRDVVGESGDVFINTASTTSGGFADVAPSLSHCIHVSSSKFIVQYLGNMILDRRYTQPMLRWIMAEMRLLLSPLTTLSVVLEIESHALRATAYDTKVVLFEHKLQTLCRFARSHQDPRCFAYQTRISADMPFSCHVFMADDEKMV